jgi:hypothetical protein
MKMNKVMNKIISILLFLYAPISFASNCPDFSGRYNSVDNYVTMQTLIVKQSGCSSLRLTYRTSNWNNELSVWKQHLILDGQKRKISANYSASFELSGQRILESGEAKLSDGSIKVIPATWYFENSNTLVYVWMSNGVPIREAYKRD